MFEGGFCGRRGPPSCPESPPRQSFNVTPVEATINTISRALRSFRPAAMPVMSRANYRRELAAWIFLPVMLGAVEGSVAGVLAINAFKGTVPEWLLNISVAVCTGAPAVANITSFLWASLSHGRHKIRFLVCLQLAAASLVAMISLAPEMWVGLLMLTAGTLGTRMCWAGVVTLRTTVWQANYPRHVRANMAGKLATVQTIMMAVAGLAIGLAMRADEQAFHWLYPIASGCGVVGALLYGRLRMRGHAALINAEIARRAGRRLAVNPLEMTRILRDDPLFRRYMSAMFIFGLGNLSMVAPLVIVIKNVFGYEYLLGIMVTGTIPILMMPVAIPFWSRLLDRMHIVPYRAFQCWSFIAANICVLIAALTVNHVLLWASAILRGVASGGGVLGWNLGHHDFTTTEGASRYMAVHVTLTGLRGLIGPASAVALYGWLEALHTGAGSWVFAVNIGATLVGAAGFIALRRSMPPESLKPAGHVGVEVRTEANGASDGDPPPGKDVPM